MTSTRKERGSRQSRIAKAGLAAMLALSLSVAPLSALADSDDGSSGTAETTSESTESASASATSAAHGLHATATQTAHSNEAEINATEDGACGLFADAGATIIANAASVKAQGAQAAAVATSATGGNVSVANSALTTSGAESPLISSAGRVEADNVQGASALAPIATVIEQGALLIANSTLESAYTGNTKDSVPISAIALYRTTTIDATDSQDSTALFQASKSTLKSAIDRGSFFYLTNTKASIVLLDNDLEFDADKANLLTAKGSDVTSGLTAVGSDTTTYGTAGKNGVTATFTAIDQELEGDVEVDSISSVDFFLLEGSMWTGASSVTANAAGADLASNIVVNIDATSGWIVTENSTVSTLNIEKGGKLVDENGKSVTIVDADGNKLVDGASDVKVTVTDEFSTTVKTTSVNELQGGTIDRTAFDEEFGTSTAFGTNGSSATLSDEERAAKLQAIITDWFKNL